MLTRKRYGSPYDCVAMTSTRKRKKQASQQGLSVPQLELVELVQELIEAHRWLQILGFANQFALTEKLGLTPPERDRILEAATRAVDKDARLQAWQQRLARVRIELSGATAVMRTAIAGGSGTPPAERSAGADAFR